RHPAAADNPFKVEEEHVVSRVAEGIEQGRRLRDALWERLFDSLYDGVGSAHPAGADPQHRSEGTGPQDTRSGLDFQAAGISRTAATGEN
ncbi:poly(3-hydroxyalkanoate) synthetase, partial [Xanthobacter sp. V7C-4]